jgi:hypothetical protein
VITVDDVQRRLDTALNAEPAAKDLAKNHKLDVVSRGIVNELIRHELLAEAAKRESLSVPEGDLQEAVAGIAPSEDPLQRTVDAAFDPRERVKDQLLSAALGKKYLEKLQITIDGALLGTADANKKADELARQVAATPDRAASLFAEATGPERQPIQNLPLTEVGAYGIYTQNQVMLAPLLGVAANTVVAFPIGGGQEGGAGTWLVAHVKKRDTNATLSGEDAASVSQVPSNWMAVVGQHLASPLAAELGVRISPRYGVWDQLAVGVAASEGEKVGVIVPVVTTRP